MLRSMSPPFLPKQNIINIFPTVKFLCGKTNPPLTHSFINALSFAVIDRAEYTFPMAHSPRNTLRIPPQNIESEKALLGSIMLRPEGMHDVIDIVSRDAFYAEKHRIVFSVMLELFGKGDPIDLVSLSSRLKERDRLEHAGGSSYLAELVNAVPSASNLKHYAELVQKKYMMRSLIEAADTISQLGYDESRDLEEVLDEAEKSIYAVTETPTLHKFVDLRDTLGEAWERL